MPLVCRALCDLSGINPRGWNRHLGSTALGNRTNQPGAAWTRTKTPESGRAAPAGHTEWGTLLLLWLFVLGILFVVLHNEDE